MSDVNLPIAINSAVHATFNSLGEKGEVVHWKIRFSRFARCSQAVLAARADSKRKRPYI